MNAKLFGTILLITSSAAWAQTPATPPAAPAKTSAVDSHVINTPPAAAVVVAPVCTGSTCSSPVSSDMAINEKGTAGTKPPKSPK